MGRATNTIRLGIAFLALASCTNDAGTPLGPDGAGPRSVIAHAENALVPGFYFLPPMVPQPSYSGTFDPTRAPVVDICVLNAARTECTGTIVKSFNGGTASEAITVNMVTESYNANWTKADLALSSGRNPPFYRLVVRDGTTVLGYADLWVVAKQGDLKSMPAGYVGVVRNSPFQIRFRIETSGTTERAPVAAPDAYEVAAGGTLTVPAGATDLLANDDLGDPTAVVDAFGGGSLGGSVGDNPAGSTVPVGTGSLTVNADGSFTFTPDAGFSGTFTFLYRITNTAGSSSALVTITVTQDPVAVDDGPEPDSQPGDAYHTFLNSALNLAAPGVLANDLLGTPAAQVVSFGGGDLGGLVTGHAAGSTASFGSGGSLTVNANGSLVFTPSTGFTGYFTFDYRIGNGSATDDATVTIAVGHRPVAMDDTYPHTLVGNVPINTASSSGFSVLGNDTHAGSTLALVGVSNGTVVLDLGTGTFQFVPTPGYEGAAGFSYSLTNGFGTVTASVSLTVAGMIWFIDGAAGAGNGALGAPFNSIAAFTAVNDGVGNHPAAGDHVFIHESASSYAGPLTLLNNQRVIGQDATSSLAALSGLTPPADSPPLPATNSGNALLVNLVSAGNGIVLAQNNVIRGLRVGNTTGTGITGSNVGSLVVSDVTVNTDGQALSLANGTVNLAFTGVASRGGTSNVSLSNLNGTANLGVGGLSGSSGTAFSVAGGNANVTYADSIANAAGRVVSVTGRSGGTLTLSGRIVDTGSGILVQDNTGGTVTFSGASKSLTTGTNAAVTLSSNGGAAIDFSGGGLAISTTSGAGFSATGGGTVQVTGSNNSVATSGGGRTVNIQNTAIGAGNVTFRSVTGTGATSGVRVENTGTSGGFKVTGDGTTASSGGIFTMNSVTASDSAAYTLTNTAHSSLEFVRVNVTTGGGAGGIAAINLVGTNLVRNSVFNYNGTAPDPVPLHNAHGIRIVQNNTNATITLDGVTINGTRAGSAAGVLSAMGNSVVTFNVIDSNTSDGFQSLFTDLFGSGWVVGAGDNAGSTAVVNLTVRDSRFTNAAPNGTNNLEMSAFENATLNYKIKDNLFQNVANASAIAGIINVNTLHSGRFGSSTAMDSIVGNTITNSGTGSAVANLGYVGIRVALENNVPGVQHRVVIANNTITDLWRQGMLLSARGQNDGFNVRVENNTVGTAALPVGQSDRRGIEVEMQASAQMNIELLNNSVYGAGTVDAAAALGLRTGIEPGTATMNATVVGNTLRSTSAGTGGRFRAETAGTGTGVMCLDLRSNSLEDNSKTYALTHSAGTFRVEGAGTGAVTNASIQAANTTGVGNVTGTVLYNNGLNCPQPAGL